jgi:hypothetical protein
MFSSAIFALPSCWWDVKVPAQDWIFSHVPGHCMKAAYCAGVVLIQVDAHWHVKIAGEQQPLAACTHHLCLRKPHSGPEDSVSVHRAASTFGLRKRELPPPTVASSPVMCDAAS